MGELSAKGRMMRRIVTLAATAALGALLFSVSPGAAETGSPDATAGAATDFSAQSRPRARTRIRVQKYYPYRRWHSVYPVPYDIEYPGPNAKRACTARYVQEYRPSGTVVVPRMSCNWVRG
jgi:hypothetical protein